MKKNAEIVSVIGLVLVLLFFAGCKTVPSAAQMADPVDFLPRDADIYFRIDASENTSLVHAVVGKFVPDMAETDRQKLVDMLHMVYVAQNSETKQIFVAATGNFPSLKSLAFTKKNGWTKQKKVSYVQYIHESGMEIAFPEKNLVFFSNGSIVRMQDYHVDLMIHGYNIEHNTVFDDEENEDGSKPGIVFSVSEPKMQTLGLSILNTIIGNISLVRGTAELVPLSETVAEKTVQKYSIDCTVTLKEPRALVPVRLLISKAFSVEAETAGEGVVAIHDFLIEEEKLLSYFIGG